MNAGLTFAIVLVFCAVHLFVGKLRFLDVTPRSRSLSFAGGVAVAYVFLHILPELSAHAELLRTRTGLTESLAKTVAYAMGLLGLALYYGIERSVVASKGEGEGEKPREHADHELFWLHIGANAFLSAIIVYLLVQDVEDSTIVFLIYSAAVTVHFLSSDFGSHQHHRHIYHRAGRWVLVGATLLGWILGLTVVLPEILVTGLVAFVGGGIILVTLKEELPSERESRFLPFAIGAIVYTGLIAAQAVLSR